MNVQLTIKKWNSAWGVERTLGDWGPIPIAHNRTAKEAQDFAWQCAQAYADQEHKVVVTIDATSSTLFFNQLIW